MRILIPALVAAVLMAVVWQLNLPKDFGAHPWGSMQVVLYGAPIGILAASLAALLPVKPLIRLALFALATAAAFWVAKNGQHGFAASYAEDAAAGQRWFLGWNATMITLAATLTSLIQYLFRR
jgi:hypothetical protein